MSIRITLYLLGLMFPLLIALSAKGAMAIRSTCLTEQQRDPESTSSEAVPEQQEPWTGMISEIETERLRSIVQEDTQFMLGLQKDIQTLLIMRNRLPHVFRAKYRNINDAAKEFFEGTAQVSLTMGSLAGLMTEAISVYKNFRRGMKLLKAAREIAILKQARLHMMITAGRSVPTTNAHDVPLGALYYEYLMVARAANMKFYAKTQDWYKFKGKQPVPIYSDVEHLDSKIGLLHREEQFIIDEIKSHILPETFYSKKDVNFTATNPFEEEFENQISDPKVAVTKMTDVQFGKFGHLGDGRGWVRLDMTSSFGGVAEMRPFSAEERLQRCQLVQQKLSQLTLPDNRTLDALRNAVSKARRVTHNVWWDVGDVAVSVACIGTALFVPPAAIAAGIVGTAAGLTSRTLSVGSQAAFQAFLEPLLQYTLISLANLEFFMFASDIVPRSGESICSFDPGWLNQFKKDFTMPEKIACDIVDNKCEEENQFCMREGVFTRTTGRHLRTGFCMLAAWPLMEAGMMCTVDSECRSGVCDLTAEVDMSDTDGVESNILEFVSEVFGDGDPRNDVARMTGRCVEPCDLKDSTCDRHHTHSEFKIRKYVA